MCHARTVTSERPAYRVQSVDRAADVLEALAGAEALNLSEVAALVGGSKSAVLGTLTTLAARKLVRITGTGADRRYHLGLALARLGSLAVARVDLASAARPMLAHLAERTAMSAQAGLWVRDGLTVVARHDPPTDMRIDLPMGPLHATSMGKACLLTLPPDELTAVVSELRLERRTKKTITEPAELVAEVERCRRRGYAVDDEEDVEGIVCVGAPVVGPDGRALGALSVTGIRSALSARREREVGKDVAAAAAAVTASLGT